MMSSDDMAEKARVKQHDELLEVWDNCTNMWKWIVDRIEEDEDSEFGKEETDVYKDEYMKLNGISLVNECYFCEYATKQRGEEVWQFSRDSCASCPGTLVSPNFDCERHGINWFDDPEEFYELLVKLRKEIV